MFQNKVYGIFITETRTKDDKDDMILQIEKKHNCCSVLYLFDMMFSGVFL